MNTVNPFRETLLQLTSGFSGTLGIVTMALLLGVMVIGFKERLVPLVVVCLIMEIIIAGMYIVK